MEYTQNYQLPLWDKEDAIQRTDFNENNQKIDAVLKGLEGCARVTVGTYTGDGADSRIIELPFTPAVVFLFLTFEIGGVYRQTYILTDVFSVLLESDNMSFSAVSSACSIVENGLRVGGIASNYSEALNRYIAIG